MARIQFNFMNDEGQSPSISLEVDQNVNLPDDDQLRTIGTCIAESGWIPAGFFAQGYRFISADVYRETVRNVPATPDPTPPQEEPVEVATEVAPEQQEGEAQSG